MAEVAEKSRDLERQLRDMEGFDTLGLDDLCLVTNLVIPPKFKVSNFKKYKGDSCPKTAFGDVLPKNDFPYSR